MSVRLGLNLEFARHENHSFDDAIRIAAEIGYEYVEPMVHTGRQLLSEGGYLHSISMLEDPRDYRDRCERVGVKVSALSSHAQLVKPDVAVDYLRAGIRFAADMGVDIVNTSEGNKRGWTTEAEDFCLIRYSLKVASADAERRGVTIALEPHHQYSGYQEGMDRLLALVESRTIGVNFDTGNAYLGGRSDIYGWLEHVLPRLIHIHAKDISTGQSERERGQVTGTAVGCACGDGVIDWDRIITIAAGAPREIVLSVECGTVEEAERSYRYLSVLS